MKKFAIAIALVVTSLSLAGCFVGKGKAPPPVVTRGWRISPLSKVPSQQGGGSFIPRNQTARW